MSVAYEPIRHYREALAQGLKGSSGYSYPWLEKQRQVAASRFLHQSFPTRKDEDWRYSGIDRVLVHPFLPAGENVSTLTEEDLRHDVLYQLDAYHLVLINGIPVPALSRLDGLPAGVHIMGMREAMVQFPDLLAARLGKTGQDETQMFMLLNRALFDDGCLVYIEADCVIDKPIVLNHLTTGLPDNYMFLPRNLVVLGAGANAALIERFGSTGPSTCFNIVLTEISLEHGAVLDHYRIQEESRHTFHMSRVSLQQAARSRYEGTSITLGSAWSRTEFNARFDEQDAVCLTNGIYVVDDGQLMDFHVDIEHAVPSCVSRERFKGILLGKGRAVFDGHVKVLQDAQQTDAHLSNTNLLLEPGAEVDIKPQLEIYADDVKCSHGTSIAQLEPEQLFYLQSRGLDIKQAKQMLCLGFVSEVLETCKAQVVMEYVGSLLQREFLKLFSDG